MGLRCSERSDREGPSSCYIAEVYSLAFSRVDFRRFTYGCSTIPHHDVVSPNINVSNGTCLSITHVVAAIGQCNCAIYTQRVQTLRINCCRISCYCTVIRLNKLSANNILVREVLDPPCLSIRQELHRGAYWCVPFMFSLTLCVQLVSAKGE